MPVTPARANKKQDRDAVSDQDKAEARRRPFDTRELERLPTTNDNDPPYRPWWVID